MMRILFLIRSLGAGGAERQLVNLAIFLQNQGHDIHVVVFYNSSVFQEDLIKAGVTVHCLNKKSRWHVFGFIKNFIALVKRIKPHIIHGYLPVSNIIVTLCKPFISKDIKIIYGIRASYMDLTQYDWVEKWIAWLEVKLSKWANLIICNSKAGWDYAKKKGFDVDKMTIIYNGIDIDAYFPDHKLGQKFRQRWVGKEAVKLIGLVARIDPMKDHHNFLHAASLLCQRRPDVRFVCVGSGIQELKEDLCRYADELNISNHVIWVDHQSDLVSVYNALDICCLSSYGEGFPNVIGEAMACDIPCVATNVGDTSIIIGETGYIVPVKDPQAFADALDKCLSRQIEPLAIRSRILENFTIQIMGEKTSKVLSDLHHQVSNLI